MISLSLEFILLPVVVVVVVVVVFIEPIPNTIARYILPLLDQCRSDTWYYATFPNFFKDVIIVSVMKFFSIQCSSKILHTRKLEIQRAKDWDEKALVIIDTKQHLQIVLMHQLLFVIVSSGL